MWYWCLYGLLAAWVLYDARQRDTTSLIWAAGTLIFGPVIFPVYVAKRPLKHGEVRAGGAAWNILRNFALYWHLPMIVLAFAVTSTFIETNRLLETYNPSAKYSTGATLCLALIGIMWGIPIASALLLGLCFKDSSAVDRGPWSVPEG